MRKRRGLSLIEVLMVSSMLTIFMGLILGTLETGGALFARSLEASRERDVLSIVQNTVTRARFSQLGSLSRAGGRTAMATAYRQGQFQTDAHARPLWQGHDLYLLKDGNLSLAFHPTEPHTEAYPLELGTLPTQSDRLLLTNVDSFEIEPMDDHWRLRLRTDGREVERWIVPVN